MPVCKVKVHSTTGEEAQAFSLETTIFRHQAGEGGRGEKGARRVTRYLVRRRYCSNAGGEKFYVPDTEEAGCLQRIGNPNFLNDRRRAAREVTSGREICDCEYQAMESATGRLDYWTKCKVDTGLRHPPSHLPPLPIQTGAVVVCAYLMSQLEVLTARDLCPNGVWKASKTAFNSARPDALECGRNLGCFAGSGPQGGWSVRYPRVTQLPATIGSGVGSAKEKATIYDPRAPTIGGKTCERYISWCDTRQFGHAAAHFDSHSGVREFDAGRWDVQTHRSDMIPLPRGYPIRRGWSDYSPPTQANRARYPVGAAPAFSHKGIVPDDADAAVLSRGYPASPRHCIPAPLHTLSIYVNAIHSDHEIRAPGSRTCLYSGMQVAETASTALRDTAGVIRVRNPANTSDKTEHNFDLYSSKNPSRNTEIVYGWEEHLKSNPVIPIKPHMIKLSSAGNVNIKASERVNIELITGPEAVKTVIGGGDVGGMGGCEENEEDVKGNRESTIYGLARRQRSSRAPGPSGLSDPAGATCQ
ncbi:hypothetical protein PR048_007890 [Dryococelus australis]|uniref:Uncharacterized protein n=1 Tax=Dryococelus australis TaxID=614101 RepID=A0ABQ9HWF9_9NEOP|nr:hypothetical protein PR048_007890 [Dryococelus australis]